VPSETPIVSTRPSEMPIVSTGPSEMPIVSTGPSETPIVSTEPSETPIVSVVPSETPIVSVEPSELPISKPTGRITVVNNIWDTFLEIITFGIYHVEEQEVEILADSPVGISQIEYCITEQDVELDQMETLTFVAYQDDSKPMLRKGTNNIIYAKITDNNNSVIYIRSDGIVIEPEPSEAPTVSPEPSETPTVSSEPSEAPTVSPEVSLKPSDIPVTTPPTQTENPVVLESPPPSSHTQPPSVQPPSVQPPSIQPPSVQPPSIQPPSVQPPNVKTPKKPASLKVKNKKGKKIVISWKKVIGADGYQVTAALDKKFKKGKKEKDTKKIQWVIKKVKRKKTYYIRVRAYTLNGEIKRYGKWTAVKRIKIKK
jgi:hypothetical protein